MSISIHLLCSNPCLDPVAIPYLWEDGVLKRLCFQCVGEVLYEGLLHIVHY